MELIKPDEEVFLNCIPTMFDKSQIKTIWSWGFKAIATLNSCFNFFHLNFDSREAANSVDIFRKNWLEEYF